MKDKEFVELNKKEKLNIPINQSGFDKVENVSRVLFIPTGKKLNGYSACAFFVCSKGKWIRLMDYDCFRFINAQPYLKGDFENNGIQFFVGDDMNWIAEYGGEFRRELKNNS